MAFGTTRTSGVGLASRWRRPAVFLLAAALAATGAVGLGASASRAAEPGLFIAGALRYADSDTSDLRAGMELEISWQVRNDSGATVTDLVVTDTLATADGAPITCDQTTLLPGAITDCRRPAHKVTAAEAQAGSLSFQATATAIDAAANPVASNPLPSYIVVKQGLGPLDIQPNLVFIDKNGNDVEDAGDAIGVSVVVVNNTGVDIADLTITSPLAGADGVAFACESTSLADGEQTTCVRPDHTISAAEAKTGVLSDELTALASAGGTTIASDSKQWQLPLQYQASNDFTWSESTTFAPDRGSWVAPGDTVTRTFTVTNTGEDPLTGLTVLTGQVDTPVTCESTALDPGASTTCEGVLLFPASYLTAGWMSFGVSLSAAFPTGDVTHGGEVAVWMVEVREPDPIVNTLDVVPTIAYSRQNADGSVSPGDTVSRTWSVTNGGEQALTNLEIAAGDDATAVTCDKTSLAVGESATCRAGDLVVTPSHLAAGELRLSYTAHAEYPAGKVAQGGDSTTVTVPVSKRPSAEIALTALAPSLETTNADGTVSIGDAVRLNFRVVNTGPETISGLGVASALGIAVCGAATLAPGAETTCTTDPHAVTAADRAAGAISTAGTATADAESGPVTATTPASADVMVVDPIVFETDPVLVVSGHPVWTDPQGDSDQVGLGDSVELEYAVTNEGMGPATDIRIASALATADGAAITCDVTALRPGESTDCHRSPHVVSAADVAAGALSDSFRALGLDGLGANVASESKTFELPIAPGGDDEGVALTVTKTAATGSAQPGDEIEFTITVENDTDLVASGVVLTDPLPADLEFVSAADGASYEPTSRAVSLAVGVLAAGERASFSIVAALGHDATAGEKIVNTATVAQDGSCPASSDCSGVAAIAVEGASAQPTEPATSSPTPTVSESPLPTAGSSATPSASASPTAGSPLPVTGASIGAALLGAIALALAGLGAAGLSRRGESGIRD